MGEDVTDQKTIRSICLLGATGSIGKSTLDLVRRNPDKYQVTALTANVNAQELARLSLEFKPAVVALANENKADILRDQLQGSGIEILLGQDGIIEAAKRHSDFVMAAIVGAAGLKPTMAAVDRGAVIGLANKECLVCAGEILMARAEKSGAKILPVDSEHNAIYQVFDFNAPEHVSKIILTASGGPFLETPMVEFKNITPSLAVAHPNWDMGEKISVDSATLMNKGLEIIEAYHLFPVAVDQIEAIIHPQSVIHSMVEYKDGSVLAQLGSPDMRTPIAYSMAWPRRIETPVERLSLAKIGQLDFQEPNYDKFPCLKLAINALKAGGGAPVVLNAANEIAVASFMNGNCSFIDIAKIVEKTLEICDMKAPHSLASVFEIDAEARHRATEYVARV